MNETTTAKTTPSANGEKLKAVPSAQPGKKIDIPAGLLKPAAPVLSLDDRLYRLNQLYELQAKHNLLCQSREKLGAFKMKKNGEEVVLSLGTGGYNDNNAFKTAHPEIIKDVVEFIKKDIDKKIAELEPQINW
jgi:hypothetical protein